MIRDTPREAAEKAVRVVGSADGKFVKVFGVTPGSGPDVYGDAAEIRRELERLIQEREDEAVRDAIREGRLK